MCLIPGGLQYQLAHFPVCREAGLQMGSTGFEPRSFLRRDKDSAFESIHSFSLPVKAPCDSQVLLERELVSERLRALCIGFCHVSRGYQVSPARDQFLCLSPGMGTSFFLFPWVIGQCLQSLVYYGATALPGASHPTLCQTYGLLS